MKGISIIIFIVLSVVSFSTRGNPDKKHYGYGHHHHKPPHYKYGYKVHDKYHKTNFGHTEARKGHHTKGEYYVHLPDCRVQTVTYHVDHYSGYIANVKYSKNPHCKPHVHKPYKHGYH